MIRRVNKTESPFNTFFELYQKELQKQLSISDSTDSPIASAFNEWTREQLGIKTLEDVKKENLLEYQKIIFLCEHNLIFNLMFHNRFDLLRELFAEFEQKNGKKSNSKNETRKTPLQKQIVLSTTTVMAITTQQIEALFQHVEALKLEQPKLNRWLILQENLRQLEYAHATEQSQNRMKIMKRFLRALQNVIDDVSVEQSIRDEFKDLYQEVLLELTIMETEYQKLCLNKDGTINVEEKQDIAKKMMDINTQVSKKIRHKFQRHPDALKKHIDKYKQVEHDSREAEKKTNTKFEGLKEVARAQLSHVISEAKAEQKEKLDTLKSFISEARNTLQGTLTEEQNLSFEQFIQQLEEHSQSVDIVDTPEALQDILKECAEHLNHFIAIAEDIPEIMTTLPGLKEVSAHFLNVSQEKVNAPNLDPPNTSWTEARAKAVKTAPLEDTDEVYFEQHKNAPTPQIAHQEVLKAPAEEAIESPTTPQQQMKAELSSVREAEQQATLEADLFLIEEENQDDIKDHIESIEENFTSTQDKVTPLFEEDYETVTQIETLIHGLKRAFEEHQSIKASDVEKLQEAINTLSDSHPEIRELKRITKHLDELAELLEEPDNSAQLH